MSASLSAVSQSKQFTALLWFVGLMGVVWTLANWILTGSSGMLIYGGMAIAMVVIATSTLSDWRNGFYLFIVWLLFEDLARKYMGNGTILFFGKDVVAGLTFLALFRAKANREVPWFRPRFLVPLALFFGLALIQIFNTWSPSVLYGLLGLKLYFCYVPLMYVGYAMMRNGRDLERFLVYNIGLGLVIAGLGIAQSIIGFTFLTPTELAPEIQALGRLTRESPLTHQALIAPTSVFVSAGRFSFYMILVAILAVGAQAYLLLTRRRRAAWGFLGVGIALVGAMQSGSRGSIVYTIVGILTLSAGFLWGAPWRWGQGQRLVKALRRSLLVGAAGLFLMVQLFPTIIGANYAFYAETLSPSSSASQLQHRVVDYPLENLAFAFQYERWPIGYGTGTASLGMQYVAKLLGQQRPTIWVENGFGQLMLEMGILGPLLWIIWSVAFLLSAWKVVRQLRQTVYFPVALAITWYSFLLLLPFSYGGMAVYQNYVMNAYFWVLAGVLFRLPHLARASQPAPAQAAVPSRRAAPAVPVFAAHAGRS
jgi:hypothetical protein